MIDSLEDKKHTITVKVSPTRFDKFQITHQQPTETKIAEPYNEYSWMVGRILVNGRIDN